MKTKKIIFVFVLILIAEASTTCLTKNTATLARITCFNVSSIIDLPNIQEGTNQTSCSLNISQSKISILPASGFFGYSNNRLSYPDILKFPNMTVLYLDHLHIKIIMPGAFNGLEMLEELHLDNNELTELSKGVYNSLLKLKILKLNNNRIHKVETFSLSGVASLISLYLGHNEITSFEYSFFQNQKMLEFLDLSGNPLEEFYIGCNLNVSYLDLTDCRLKMLYLKSCACHKFTAIMLNNNQIKSIVGNITDVLFFWMSHNQLDVLENIFNKSKTIEVINLSFNNISTIKMESFRGLKALYSLNLEHNNIRSIEASMFYDLQNLKYLYLSHNHIQELSYGIFNRLTQLGSLDLSYNLLTKLDQNVYRSLSNLRHLDLRNNQINFLDAQDIVSKLKHLLTIGLNHNSWECEHLSHYVDVFNNKSVVLSDADSFDVENVEGIACISETIQSSMASRMLDVQSEDFEKNFGKNLIKILKKCGTRCLLLIRW